MHRLEVSLKVRELYKVLYAVFKVLSAFVKFIVMDHKGAGTVKLSAVA